MAIYKPINCYPSNETITIDNIAQYTGEEPIWIECKLDTNNTLVSAYSIELYDNDNNIVFMSSDITNIEDLHTYCTQKYPQVFNNLKNYNIGLNGTYLKIPFVVPTTDSSDGVGANQIAFNQLTYGVSYKWRICLYQECISPIYGITEFPSKSKYYDMFVGSGIILGSTNKRIQTRKISNKISLIDKYIQPIYINNLSYNRFAPQKWNGTISNTTLCNRVMISDYDSTYGHIYPNTLGNEIIPESIMNKDGANAFYVYKNGNDPSNLGASDMVQFVCEDQISEVGTHSSDMFPESTWEWVGSISNPSNSYWKQTYTIDGDDMPSNYGTTIPDGARVLFNHFMKEFVDVNGYCGSPYNGIYYPQYSYEKKYDEDDPTKVKEFNVTVRWNRTPDANTWGKLINKIIYINGQTPVNSDLVSGGNAQISISNQSGVINQTPFKFVPEEPLHIYDYDDATNRPIEIQGYISPNSTHFSVDKKFGHIKKILVGDQEYVLPENNYSYSYNSNVVFLNNNISSTISGKVKIICSEPDNNTQVGLIFYNSDQYVYIRANDSIDKNMILVPDKYDNTDNFIRISNIDKQYWMIQSKNASIFKTDDKYSIKSCYRYSDYFVFDIHKPAKISSSYTTDADNTVYDLLDSEVNTLKYRDIIIHSNYEQDDYISWRSYRFKVYESNSSRIKKSILLDSGDMFDRDIQFKIDGLQNNIHYIISLTVYTQKDQVFEYEYFVQTDIASSTHEVQAEISLDCENHCVEIKPKAYNGIVIPKYDMKFPSRSKASEYILNNTNQLPKRVWVVNDDDIESNPNHSILIDYYLQGDRVCEKNVYDLIKETSKAKIFAQIEYESILFDNKTNYIDNFGAKILSQEPVGVMNASNGNMVLESKHIFDDSQNLYLGTIVTIEDDDKTIEISLPEQTIKTDSGEIVLNKYRNGVLCSYKNEHESNDEILQLYDRDLQENSIIQSDIKQCTVSNYQPSIVDEMIDTDKTNFALITYANDTGEVHSQYLNINGLFGNYSNTENMSVMKCPFYSQKTTCSFMFNDKSLLNNIVFKAGSNSFINDNIVTVANVVVGVKDNEEKTLYKNVYLPYENIIQDETESDSLCLYEDGEYIVKSKWVPNIIVNGQKFEKNDDGTYSKESPKGALYEYSALDLYKNVKHNDSFPERLQLAGKSISLHIVADENLIPVYEKCYGIVEEN